MMTSEVRESISDVVNMDMKAENSDLKRRMELFLSPSAVSTEVDAGSEFGNSNNLSSIISGASRSRRVNTFDVVDEQNKVE